MWPAHHLRRLSFFGSVLRDDFHPDSHVDVLYEFEPGHEPGWNIHNIEQELTPLLGRRIDLVPLKYLNARIRDAQLQRVPFMLVVGQREMEAGGVAVRRRDIGDTGFCMIDKFKTWVRELIDTRANKW